MRLCPQIILPDGTASGDRKITPFDNAHK